MATTESDCCVRVRRQHGSQSSRPMPVAVQPFFRRNTPNPFLVNDALTWAQYRSYQA
jgi:hypothetical protein